MAATLVVQFQSMFPTSSRPGTRYASTPNAPKAAAGAPPHMTSDRLGQPAGDANGITRRLGTSLLTLRQAKIAPCPAEKAAAG